jgi:magnesium-transporting ATPase (P-type)
VECQDAKSKEVTNFNMVDDHLDKILEFKVNTHNEYKNAMDFFTHLAICHTIVSSRDPRDESKIMLNASSPDELSLINGAKYYGVKFVERANGNIIHIKNLNEDGRIDKYQLLNVIEFTSDRKRMTVVVKTPSG